jgi:hypothetical protein
MFNARYRAVSAFILAVTLCASASAQKTKPSELRVFPADVNLTTSRDKQSLIVQEVYPDGITRDVTQTAKLTLTNGAFAKLAKNVLHPVADGTTTLKVEHNGLSVNVPVKVQQATIDRPISFRLDIMPVFMRTSCNNGSCHGAASGKDGFRISLFGFDPAGDYHRITREISGRRINLALPKESLMLTKSVGSVPHTGGKRFAPDSEMYNTTLRWLEAGAPDDKGEVPKVLSVELYPKDGVLDGEGATQQMTVRAKFSDGTDRDITSLALFLTNNDNSAPVSEGGLITASKRGEAFIMVRYETHTVGSQFIVLPKGLKYEAPKTPENNYIDTLVNTKLRKLRINPSKLCTDEAFLRRAFLDVVGVLPTPGEFRKFMADKDPKKRDKLIDDLLTRKEFVEMWVMKWAELLQVRTVNNRVSYKSMLRYYNWLQERVASNVPMDQLVQELLSAKGGTFANAATNYYQGETNTLKISENVAQVFMGMRIQCAQCHNHPFDRWTMDDYYSFGAFFSQIGRKRGEDPREQIIYNRGSGDVRHPIGNRVMQPKFLGGIVPDVKGKDRREVMAKWLASPENPYFARNLANIVWAHFMGKGIINEVDDVRISNPPVNAALLGELGSKFTNYKYDFKKLVRDICTSRTYQLATQANDTNASDSRNFSHASLRRLRAEVLLDSISQITETKIKFRGLPLGARAVQISDGNTSTYFLTTFGRAKRESVCACEVKMEPNLSQALHLLNGSTVNGKVQQGNVVGKLLEAGKSPQDVVEELYLRCLVRLPNEKEVAALNRVLEEEKDPKGVLEDVFWALINSREFLFNH